MSDKVEKAVTDYKKYAETDLGVKLDQMIKSFDDIFNRLDELQTILRFNQRERLETIEILSSFIENRAELMEYFAKIDSIENLVLHINNVLNSLANELDKAEQKYQLPNLLTPFLFKTNPDTTDTRGTLDTFKTEDYFQDAEHEGD